MDQYANGYNTALDGKSDPDSQVRTDVGVCGTVLEIPNSSEFSNFLNRFCEIRKNGKVELKLNGVCYSR